jgi:hypothetical protein
MRALTLGEPTLEGLVSMMGAIQQQRATTTTTTPVTKTDA